MGADAFSPAAVDALLAAKGRGRDMPDAGPGRLLAGLDGLVVAVHPDARELVEAFWPGGLTIIVQHASSLAWDLGDTRGTVAVRMPAHPVALDLLTRTGPMAVSSANRTGSPPALTMADARDQLGESVTVYLDGGTCSDPVPSSIVDLTGSEPVLRRAGAVTAEALREIIPDLVVPDDTPGR